MKFFASFQIIVLGTLFIGLTLCYAWPSSLSPTVQYHRQDDLGAYQYAYTGPHHSKSETSLNGITKGGYTYVDANGIVQTVVYTADAENGFRVRASNLPQNARNNLQPVQDTPEVASAKKRHLEELKLAELRNERIASHPFEDIRNPFLQLPGNVQNPEASLDLDKKQYFRTQMKETEKFNHQPISSFPIPRISQPFVVIPYKLYHSSLHHSQDSLGQYEYSYYGDTSAKTESRSLDGTTRGAYSYIDPYGLLNVVNYIGDRNGFRVLATNLPEAK